MLWNVPEWRLIRIVSASLVWEQGDLMAAIKEESGEDSVIGSCVILKSWFKKSNVNRDRRFDSPLHPFSFRVPLEGSACEPKTTRLQNQEVSNHLDRNLLVTY